ncbi:MAG: 1-deoxy-D-xylulose-5-phosphate reductoisomerase, partial [Candidatus Omnitrophota bacterium]
NAANDVAVEGFSGGRISFTGITSVVERVMDKHRIKPRPDLNDIKISDEWARMTAAKLLEK